MRSEMKGIIALLDPRHLDDNIVVVRALDHVAANRF